MKKTILLTVTALLLFADLVYLAVRNRRLEMPQFTGKQISFDGTDITTTLSPTQKPLPESSQLTLPLHVPQTFNNCGPATLSMMLAYYNRPISQDILGAEMRPYQNPNGDNDDKSIFSNEFVSYSEKYGFSAIHRPNGDIDLVKRLVHNGFPVVLRTWLRPNEDIGHFRIVKGYDDARQVFIQDDSYDGPNLTLSYSDFIAMWQPFNYSYIVVYPPDKQELLNSVLGEDMDEQVAWRNAKARAEDELRNNPQDRYALFNLSVVYYNLGDYQKSVELFEQAEPLLPSRMLWYQTEPIEAYTYLNNKERVFTLTDAILNNNNAGFSELYFLRGKIHFNQGDKELAAQEFEKAIRYNKNFDARIKEYQN